MPVTVKYEGSGVGVALEFTSDGKSMAVGCKGGDTVVYKVIEGGRELELGYVGEGRGGGVVACTNSIESLARATHTQRLT